MFTVQNDWVTYEEAVEPVAVRRVAVRGGAACAQRLPVARDPRAVPAPQRAAARAAAPAAPVGGTARDARRAERRRLRLTRRGRVVLVVLPTLLALSGVLLAAAPGTAEAAPRVEPARTVVVGTGDSLWSIAERVAPRTDPRITVAALERANGLRDGVVAAGATLVLPLP
ncbi:LysM peptidoglycan-binding domain-containing protein [Amnibacterium soli]